MCSVCDIQLYSFDIQLYSFDILWNEYVPTILYCLYKREFSSIEGLKLAVNILDVIDDVNACFSLIWFNGPWLQRPIDTTYKSAKSPGVRSNEVRLYIIPVAYLPTLPHLNHVFCIHLKILRNHKYYRTNQDSHQMDDRFLIQGTLSRSKDDLWAVMLCTIANGACQSGTQRKRLRREMDRWIERGRGGACGGYLERIIKHSSSRSGWFRKQSAKCWQVCCSVKNVFIYREIKCVTVNGAWGICGEWTNQWIQN